MAVNSHKIIRVKHRKTSFQLAYIKVRHYVSKLFCVKFAIVTKLQTIVVTEQDSWSFISASFEKQKQVQDYDFVILVNKKIIFVNYKLNKITKCNYLKIVRQLVFVTKKIVATITDFKVDMKFLSLNEIIHYY